MSEKQINDGGAAFPCLDSTPGGLSLRDGGMSLRDYFAASLLTAIYREDKENDHNLTPDEVASDCYLFADAMLRARSR